jgi:hypothetical protein
MSLENRFRARGKDILNLLLKHGPLSFSALDRMLVPKMKKKRLKEAILRMKRKGYITSRLVGDNKTFYQFSQQPEKRSVTANYLGCHPKDLVQLLSSRRNWLHSEGCEFWIFHLAILFPHAKIIRETDFVDNLLAQRIMLIDKNELELRPDFLLVFPKTDEEQLVAIAVEVERSRKSNRRLIAKLNKYANKTLVDGLLYICETDGLVETIRLLYKNKVLDRAHRIKHYANNFFLFSDAINTHCDPTTLVYNSNQEPVSLLNWISYLKSTKRNFRRDNEFALVGSSTLAI